MKTAIIIQARMGSTRLPGKVLMEVCGKTLLAHLIERLRSKPSGELVVATTVADADQAIVQECDSLGVRVVRGSEQDVLSRYLQAAATTGAEAIVRLTADCPIMDPHVVAAMIEEFAVMDVDYLSNSEGQGLPRGQNVEVMTREALERTGREAHEPYQREHVTPYLYEKEGRCRKAEVTWPERLGRTWPVDLSRHRWTVDTDEDFQLVKLILEALYRPDHVFGIQEIVDLLVVHPEWSQINAAVEQKSYLQVG